MCRSHAATGSSVTRDAVRIASQRASTARDFERCGNTFFAHATPGTAAYLEASGVEAETITDFGEHLQNLHQDDIALVVNTATHGRRPERLGFQLRRWSVERGVTCLTSLDTVKALLFCLEDALEKGFDVVDLAKI